MENIFFRISFYPLDTSSELIISGSMASQKYFNTHLSESCVKDKVLKGSPVPDNAYLHHRINTWAGITPVQPRTHQPKYYFQVPLYPPLMNLFVAKK